MMQSLPTRSLGRSVLNVTEERGVHLMYVPLFLLVPTMPKNIRMTYTYSVEGDIRQSALVKEGA